MEATRIDSLEAVRDALAPLVSEGFDALASGSVSDVDLIDVLRVGGDLRRLVDALVVAATEQVSARSQGPRHERFTSLHGARDVNEVVRNTTRCDARTAKAGERAAAVVRRERSITSGELMPARFPMLADALRDGVLGVPGILAATGPLVEIADRVAAEGLAAADAALADAARGSEVDGQSLPPLCPDDLGNLARLWADHLDEDGAAPREDEALRRRGFMFRPARDGLIPVGGNLLPEVAGQLMRLFDAIVNPRAGQGQSLSLTAPNPTVRASWRRRRIHGHPRRRTTTRSPPSSPPLLAPPTLQASAVGRPLLSSRFRRRISLQAGVPVGSTGLKSRSAPRRSRTRRAPGRCNASSTTPRVGSCRSTPQTASSTPPSAKRSWPEMADASSPAARCAPHGAKSTTSPTTQKAAPPIPTTACWPVGAITELSM